MLKYNNYLPYGLKILDNFVVRKFAQVSSREAYNFIKLVATRQINKPDSTIVPVYRFRNIGFNKGTYKYYYDMKQLGMISATEKEIIQTAADEWSEVNWNISASKHPVLIKGKQEFPKLISFLEDIIYQDKYGDLHGGNIMLDDDYNYRLIDLEGFIKLPFNDPKNNWLTK